MARARRTSTARSPARILIPDDDFYALVAVVRALREADYEPWVARLDGRRTLESALEQTKLDVRHYAKRQLSWFRHEVGVEWVEGFGEEAWVQEEVLARLRE